MVKVKERVDRFEQVMIELAEQSKITQSLVIARGESPKQSRTLPLLRFARNNVGGVHCSAYRLVGAGCDRIVSTVKNIGSGVEVDFKDEYLAEKMSRVLKKG